MSTRPLLAIPALALVAIAGWEVAAARRDSASGAPDDAAWDRASAAVRAGFRPGDLIVFAPAWNDPVGRLHLGDLISIDDAARPDADRYPRIWELAIRGAHAPDVAALGAPAVAQDIAGIAVRRYDRAAPPKLLASARDLIGNASIDRRPAKGPTLSLEEVGFEPHRCVLVVPGANDPVAITFAAVPLGRTLVVHAGIADVFTRRDERTPGRIQVVVDDLALADRELGVEDGWVRIDAATSPHTADVTVTLACAAANRQICFTLEARE